MREKPSLVLALLLIACGGTTTAAEPAPTAQPFCASGPAIETLIAIHPGTDPEILWRRGDEDDSPLEHYYSLCPTSISADGAPQDILGADGVATWVAELYTGGDPATRRWGLRTPGIDSTKIECYCPASR